MPLNKMGELDSVKTPCKEDISPRHSYDSLKTLNVENFLSWPSLALARDVIKLY